MNFKLKLRNYQADGELSYGLLVHVLDAANFIKACWGELTPDTISAFCDDQDVPLFSIPSLLS